MLLIFVFWVWIFSVKTTDSPFKKNISFCKNPSLVSNCDTVQYHITLSKLNLPALCLELVVCGWFPRSTRLVLSPSLISRSCAKCRQQRRLSAFTPGIFSTCHLRSFEWMWSSRLEVVKKSDHWHVLNPHFPCEESRGFKGDKHSNRAWKIMLFLGRDEWLQEAFPSLQCKSVPQVHLSVHPLQC